MVRRNKSASKQQGESGKISRPASASTRQDVLIRKLIARGNKAAANVNVLHTLEDASSNVSRYYTTTVPPLDVILNGKVGLGFPAGRITEIFGDEHSGKTTLCGLTLAAVQEENGIAIIFDTEATFTTMRAAALGVDGAKLIYGEHEFLEDILDALPVFAAQLHNDAGLLVWDSVAGTASAKEAGHNTGEYSLGAHARALSQGLRKLSRSLAKSQLAVVALNQRKVGGIANPFSTERDADATLGGKALRFHAAIRLRLKYTKKFALKMGAKSLYVGDEMRAMVVKHKERGSGTRASECVLVLVKIGKDAGKFDNAISCLRTLQHWGSLPLNNIRFAGKKYTQETWRKAYDTDATFRRKVCCFLELCNHKLAEAEDAPDPGSFIVQNGTAALEEE